MTRTVVYDACVLVPAPLRDLLVRAAHAGLVRGRWTEAILDECFRAILTTRPGLDPTALERTRRLMNAAVRDCVVTGYEPLIAGLELPDPNDRHVLAAAIRCRADAIVTANVRDFPGARLAAYGIEVQQPDELMLHLAAVAPDELALIVIQQAKALRMPARSALELLETLRRQGLVRSAARIRELLRAHR